MAAGFMRIFLRPPGCDSVFHGKLAFDADYPSCESGKVMSYISTSLLVTGVSPHPLLCKL